MYIFCDDAPLPCVTMTLERNEVINIYYILYNEKWQ